jgi:micrococcal nuclease
MQKSIWSQILEFILALIQRQLGGAAATSKPVSKSNVSPASGLLTVKIANVIDGDTLDLADGQRIRYLGVNTPEREQAGYNEAKSLNQRLVKGKTVQVEFDVEKTDQYGRTLAYIWADGVLVNRELLQQGYATTLFMPPNERYKAEFQQAEQAARQAKLGIWQGSSVPLKITKIQANAPGEDNVNPNGEWIEITNQGKKAVAMRGYLLKDSANNMYTFGNFTLAAGATVRIHSGQGQDNATTLFWGLVDNSVWNNVSDTAFLRDTQGGLVDSYSY